MLYICLVFKDQLARHSSVFGTTRISRAWIIYSFPLWMSTIFFKIFLTSSGEAIYQLTKGLVPLAERKQNDTLFYK